MRRTSPYEIDEECADLLPSCRLRVRLQGGAAFNDEEVHERQPSLVSQEENLMKREAASLISRPPPSLGFLAFDVS